MATTEHQIDTLGKKHQQYNRLLKEALQNDDHLKLEDLNFNESDINNLLKIDIACHTKNVNYILKVFKCDDSLYVSKAIQKSTWLITENQYKNIINPDYLNNKLYPEMTTKACIKLKKNIMHNLVDEFRLQDFYRTEKCSKTAVKWLLRCSISFIEENIQKHCAHLEPFLLKRFCEKSISIFKILVECCLDQPLLSSTMFLVYKHTDIYLDAVESASHYTRPMFNARATETIMKHDPQRIINNFHRFASIVNIQVFAKYLPKQNIKDFLYQLATECSHKSRYQLRLFFNGDNILYIIKQMPKEEQFEFVKKVFIDDIYTIKPNEALPLNLELNKMKKLRDVITQKNYVWYQFASFEVAFDEIKKLLINESKQINKNEMLAVLLKSTDHNLKYIEYVLEYYKDKHKNDDNSTKCKFIGDLMNLTNINKYDKRTWTILNEIFKSMNAYEESSDDHQICLIAIILYKVIHKENVPEVIENKFKFNTMKSYCKFFNENEKQEVFNYISKYLLTKIDVHNTENESDFRNVVGLVNCYLNLLLDWKKELRDFPLILLKIRKLIEIRQVNSWKIDLSSLYNVKKSWRKLMFEESLSLCPSEKVYINALKHDPSIFDRFKAEVEIMRINEDVSLHHFLTKIRIFWSQSLANEWKNIYLDNLNILGSHKAVIRGLCSLLLQQQLLNIIQQYAPEDEKINWSKIDELKLSLQRHIAKNMHFARPQPNADAILLYAKGDYLNYALPSLDAIFYNMNVNTSRVSFRKLFDSRVSLQKHVIRSAFVKLEHEEIKEIFSSIWNSSKNASIRCILFEYTFKSLCNQKEDIVIKCYSDLLESFIENVTSKEDKKLYNLFNEIDQIPIIAMSNILMKAYKLFQRLVSIKDKNKEYFTEIINTLAEHSRIVMDLLSSDFATEIIQNYINEGFFSPDEYVQSGHGMLAVMSAYSLSAKNLETQTERYDTVLRPLIQHCLVLWNEIYEEKYFIKFRLYFFLSTLRSDLKEYKEKINFAIVHNLFSNIYLELQSLPISENYILMTTCKLTLELTKLLSKQDMNEQWTEISSKCAPEFGKVCLKFLKTDVKTYFPCIYVLFTKALKIVVDGIFTDQEKLQICEILLSDSEFIQAYLSAMNIFPGYISNELESQANTIKENFLSHPSVEVKMHYYNKFSR